jgi:ATP-dependent Zn protease
MARPVWRSQEIDMKDVAHTHCTRSWWMRPPVWFTGIAVVAALAFVIFENVGGPAATPYSTFLDQLDAGNVASVTFEGTQIDGRFKHPLTAATSSGTKQNDTFRSRVPDFGDSSLIPELRKQHVAFDVTLSSQWTSWLGRLPWPMVFILGAVLIAALVRFVRGGKPGSVSPMSMHPMGGMMGLISGLFGRQQAESPPASDRDKAKSQ